LVYQKDNSEMRTDYFGNCVFCAAVIDKDMTMCDACRERIIESLQDMDDENGQLAHECSMCGKYCASVDKNGHCSSCRQAWNS